MVFDAIDAAKARGNDVVIVDTAGRLHTQQHLMEELAKVRTRDRAQAARRARTRRCCRSTPPPARTACARRCCSARPVDVTGIVLTKLDGTAKGGIALAIAQELGVPVKLIGIGEGIEDLRPFDPQDFARAILEP